MACSPDSCHLLSDPGEGGLDLDDDLRARVWLAHAMRLAPPDHTWYAIAADATSVLPKPLAGVTFDGGRLTAVLPPVSWAMIHVYIM
ncbi:hypothetical protein [Sphaerobacter sp.]|uniref:hypothetical protein n=1 Tax=Sphaerobacter sp. TaxID=2099654 RepID=UPI001DC71B18|nr:hypothetical protein [Sphaerobacter sp.]MBX5446653.1 hypothetical protein [Sphaerobacter sp.]